MRNTGQPLLQSFVDLARGSAAAARPPIVITQDVLLQAEEAVVCPNSEKSKQFGWQDLKVVTDILKQHRLCFTRSTWGRYEQARQQAYAEGRFGPAGPGAAGDKFFSGITENRSFVDPAGFPIRCGDPHRQMELMTAREARASQLVTRFRVLTSRKVDLQRHGLTCLNPKEILMPGLPFKRKKPGPPVPGSGCYQP